MDLSDFNRDELEAFRAHVSNNTDALVQCALLDDGEKYARKWLKVHRKLQRWPWFEEYHVAEIIGWSLFIGGLIFGTSHYY